MSSPEIRIAADSPTPIFRQIVAQVRLHIDQGAIVPGEALPSVRSLATQLGVHFNTVAESYRELAEEGLIELAQGKRATVRAPGPPRRLPRAQAARLRQALHHVIAEMRLKGICAAAIQQEVNTLLQR